jgi:hypothetical protein
MAKLMKAIYFTQYNSRVRLIKEFLTLFLNKPNLSDFEGFVGIFPEPMTLCIRSPQGFRHQTGNPTIGDRFSLFQQGKQLISDLN